MLRGMLSTTLFLAIMLAMFAPVDMVVMHFVPKFKRYAVGHRIPDQFPVLVIQSTKSKGDYKAKIVEYANLHDYLRNVNHYSFSVVLDSVKELNRQVSERKDSFGYGSSNKFQVKPLPHGRQRLIVYGGSTMEDCNTGWYTADAHKFEPEYHQKYYSGEKAIYEVPPVIGAACAVWFGIRLFVRRLSRRQVEGIPSQE